MEKLLILIFTVAIFFFSFLFFLITGLIRKNKTRIFISFAALVFTLCFSSWAVYVFVTKSYNKVSNAFKPREGAEIYIAVFGSPDTNCMTVLNWMDQIVPRLDCCIWLEFKTCQNELDRIISQEQYNSKKYLSADTISYIPSYGPKPKWWTPHILGDSIIVMQNYNPQNPNRDKILIFSKDSTHAFYCDMAD